MSDATTPRLKVSREGVVLIKSFEGFRPRAVRGEDGRWVIGYGHRASAREGLTVSEADAELLLQYDLLPVAKAYSGLTDAELTRMDHWIKKHTREKFGPVRSVEATAETGQVFEIAFEGIQASTRHKAGIALRFPRIARWRTDKRPGDANTLDDLKAFLRQ